VHFLFIENQRGWLPALDSSAIESTTDATRANKSSFSQTNAGWMVLMVSLPVDQIWI
jgi:hypothetical protein